MKLDSRKIKGVIFDVDGTLLDSMPIWDDVCERYLRSMGVEPAADLNEHVLNMTIDEGVHYVKIRYELPQPEEELKDGLLAMIRHFYYEEAPCKPGAAELVETFAKYQIPMVIATSGDKDLAGTALKRLGLLQHFKAIFTSNDLNTGKGDPYIFYTAANALFSETINENLLLREAGENTADILANIYVIEDSLKATKTAVNAGFSTIAVEDETSRDTFEELQQVANYYVASLEEVEIV